MPADDDTADLTPTWRDYALEARQALNDGEKAKAISLRAYALRRAQVLATLSVAAALAEAIEG